MLQVTDQLKRVPIRQKLKSMTWFISGPRVSSDNTPPGQECSNFVRLFGSAEKGNCKLTDQPARYKPHFFAE